MSLEEQTGLADEGARQLTQSDKDILDEDLDKGEDLSQRPVARVVVTEASVAL